MSVSQAEYCKACDLDFDNWDDFLKHKITSQDHPYACLVCGKESRSDNARKSHELQVRSPTQTRLLVLTGSFTPPTKT